MEAAGLRLRDLVVRYGETVAVDGVSIDLPPGQVLGLLGPSGSGKSSLLRAVAGLEPVAGGTVSWDGEDLDGVPVHRRGFGLMFQDGQLFPHRDVAGNIAFGLRMAGMPRAERAARVRELLDVVGLTGYGRRGVSELSGGERQRVALARSLAPRPRLLLLDEPLSALDAELRGRLAGELRDALVRTGTTAMLVTHDQDEAFAVADRVAVLDRGRLLQVADPAALWHRPASRRVAQFLGYEVFVTVPVADGVVTDGPLRGLRLAWSGEPADGGSGADGEVLHGEVVVALAEGSLLPDVSAEAHPEDDAAVGGAPRLTGTVERVVPGRGWTRLVVDVPGLGPVPVRSSGRHPTGDRLHLVVDPEAVAVLPPG